MLSHRSFSLVCNSGEGMLDLIAKGSEGVGWVGG